MKSINIMGNTLKYFFLFAFCYLFVAQSIAQNDINTPYSKFGVGNVSPRFNHILGSMGGVGYALQHPYYINFKNPAALAAFDSLSFIADFSFSAVNQQLKNDKLTQSGTFAQFDYLAIGLPILKVWRMSAGIMPYSDVGYGILETRKIDSLGTDKNVTLNYQYKGTGGLHLFYWGNAFKVCKGLTLGMNLSYLFGTINTSSYSEYSTEHTLNTMINNFRYLDGIYIAGGVQYHTSFKEKHSIGLGAVYENSIKVWSRENLIVLNYFGTYNPNLSFDTVRYETGKKASKSTVKLPQVFGGGLSYGYKDRILASVDVSWQNWKKFSMKNSNDKFQNNWITAFGVQYVPNPSSSKYFNKINFRVGARYATGYFVVKNHAISEFAVSFGLGFPIRTFTSRSSVNVMFEYNRIGMVQNNLILQNCYRLSFNFILQEKWYQRRKIE